MTRSEATAYSCRRLALASACSHAGHLLPPSSRPLPPPRALAARARRRRPGRALAAAGVTLVLASSPLCRYLASSVPPPRSPPVPCSWPRASRSSSPRSPPTSHSFSRRALATVCVALTAVGLARSSSPRTLATACVALAAASLATRPRLACSLPPASRLPLLSCSPPSSVSRARRC